MPLLLALVGAFAPAAAGPWPADTDWDALRRDGSELVDACGDVPQNDWWNLIGKGSDAAAYMAYDGTDLFFRIRLAASPINANDVPDQWRDLGIGILIESDWDDEFVKYDFAVFLDGPADAVELWANEVPGDSFDHDSPEQLLASWSAAAVGDGAARQGRSGTHLCTGGEADWYVDVRVPWREIESRSGIADPKLLSMAITTSMEPGHTFFDIAGCPVQTYDGDVECTRYWEMLVDTAEDSDNDLLSNRDELGVWGTDPYEIDTDNDGLMDGIEVREETNPLDPDTDGGGVNDGAEILIYDSDPLDPDDDYAGAEDADKDGLGDWEELRVYNTNPYDADSDDDGLIDGDEIRTHSTDPLDADTDGDALTDSEEVQVHQTDPLDADTDAGGVPDGPEAHVGTSPLDPRDDFTRGGSTSGDRYVGGGGAWSCDQGGGATGGLWSGIVAFVIGLLRRKT